LDWCSLGAGRASLEMGFGEEVRSKGGIDSEDKGYRVWRRVTQLRMCHSP